MAPLRKSYVSFVEARQGRGVTRTWYVLPDMSEARLGIVRWHAPWRRYCFFPDPNTLYDGACLQEIAGFCNRQTNLRKMERRAERMQASAAS